VQRNGASVSGPIDLVQVRTFVHLYDTRSVTAAAELLHVTQPSVSYTLGKLRRRFGEELFVRTAQGLEPTPTATELYEPFRSALETLDRVAGPTVPFDPAVSEREFTMMLSELGELSFLPLLLGRFRALAPRARLSVRHLVVDTAPELLSRGRVDLVVTSARLPEDLLVRRPFMEVDYVAMVAADHPRLRRAQLAAGALAAERYVRVRGTTGHQGPVRLLERLGLEHRVELELTDFAAVPYVVAASELVAIVPRHIGQIFAARHAVTTRDLPWDVEPIEVATYTRRAPGAAREWFADVVLDTLSTRRFR
jgi:DNA-binding transcriptional LysR family regulator